MARTSKQTFLVCDCLIFSISFIYFSFILSIIAHFNNKAIKHLNSYLKESRGEVQSPSREIWLQVLFWVIGYIISYYIVLNCNLISYIAIHPPFRCNFILFCFQNHQFFIIFHSFHFTFSFCLHITLPPNKIISISFSLCPQSLSLFFSFRFFILFGTKKKFST